MCKQCGLKTLFVGCLQTMWAHLLLLWVRRPACLLPMWADKCPCLRASLLMIVGRYTYGTRGRGGLSGHRQSTLTDAVASPAHAITPPPVGQMAGLASRGFGRLHPDHGYDLRCGYSGCAPFTPV